MPNDHFPPRKHLFYTKVVMLQPGLQFGKGVDVFW